MLTLLLGGARSGKSTLAVEMGRRHHGPVTFVATSRPIDGDMSERIARHRAERPGWPTVEEPLDLAGALVAADDGNLVIVDCLTLWVGNLLHRGDGDAAVEALSTEAAMAATDRQGPTVVVSNEVGMGVHPETALGMRYRDLLGRVNQHWAAAADTSLLLVAGRAVTLTDPWAVLA
jgi:adenosylcobinamide kinase / adenosylcobinamide-phosphate guanylyltransferase